MLDSKQQYISEVFSSSCGLEMADGKSSDSRHEWCAQMRLAAVANLSDETIESMNPDYPNNRGQLNYQIKWFKRSAYGDPVLAGMALAQKLGAQSFTDWLGNKRKRWMHKQPTTPFRPSIGENIE